MTRYRYLTRALRPVFLASLLAAALGLVGASAGGAVVPFACPRSLCAPIAPDSAWRALMIDPKETAIAPAHVFVIRGAGTVRNAGALVGARHGAATITVTSQPGPALLLDMGTDVGGRVQVRVLRSTAPVRLAYSEQRRYMTAHGDTLSGSLGTDDDPDARVDVIAPSSTPSTFVSPGIRGGERWIRVSLDAPGSATIKLVRVRYDGYPPNPAAYAGHFLSSDPLVNRTWYASVYTEHLDSIKAPRANRVLVDGAKRDRLVWLGDLAIEGLTAFYSSPGEVRVLRDSLAVFACQQETDGFLPEASLVQIVCPVSDPTAPGSRIPPNPLVNVVPIGSYTPWWIVSLYQYYLYTGDAGYVRRELPAVPRALQWMRSREAGGLYDTSLPNELNWHPFDQATGADAHTNSVYYQALVDAASLERSVGHDSGTAARLEAHAQAVRAALLRRLWDPRAGALRGNAADPLVNHTQDANVYAVLAGVLTGGRAESALRYVRRHLYTRLGPVNGQFKHDPFMSYYISPYISSWELWARFGRGDGRGALDLDRRLFGYMARADPGTLWEKMSVAGRPQAYAPGSVSANLPGGAILMSPGSTSLAHGWSTGPASALSAFVLGVRPLSPGFKRWLIAPDPSGLRWAQGQVSSPHGVLVSRWIHGAGYFRLTIVAPGGTEGTVVLPRLGRAGAAFIDGRLVWHGRASGAKVRVRVSAGAISFVHVHGAHAFLWLGA